MKNIGIIGTGNMGSAVVKAIAKKDATLKIKLADVDKAKAEALAAELPLAELSENADIAASCDLIILAVKPQMMADMLAGIAPVLKARTDRFVICSMAAGMACENIRQLAGGDYPIIRIMPNTPMAIGCGMTEYCGLGASEKELAEFEALLSESGTVDRLEERLIDAASAVTGCGPAFVYMMAEALADGVAACGLPRDKANKYAAAMIRGAGGMLLESGKHPGQLKDAVCSPAGSTIEGVLTLEESGFRGAVSDAVIAAYEKTLKLGK